MTRLPLATASLVLRPFVMEDAAAILRLNAEPTTSRWLPSHVYADLGAAQDALRYLIDCLGSPGDPRVAPLVLGVALAAERADAQGRAGALIGHVGFSPYDEEVEVSYAIAEAERGRGYGTEALVAACDWAAAAWPLPAIVAMTAAANQPSRRVLERASFVHSHDAPRRFQGSEQLVSRYTRRPAGSSRGADRAASSSP